MIRKDRLDPILFVLSGIRRLALPNGSVALRGVAIAPSGKLAAVTHNVARFQVLTTQVEHGWMNDSALGLIDLETLTLKNTKSLAVEPPDAAGDEPRSARDGGKGRAFGLTEQSVCAAAGGGGLGHRRLPEGFAAGPEPLPGRPRVVGSCPAGSTPV
jgi:hypothetical protein